MVAPQAAYDELAAYTLTHGDPAFIHQHVVDAFAAQHATEATKPITVAFALIGLYLRVERGFTGRQVQRAHMMLARRSRTWPVFPLPESRGQMTVAHVLAAPPSLPDFLDTGGQPSHVLDEPSRRPGRSRSRRTSSARLEEPWEVP